MARVGVKTNIGGLYFDAVLKVDHTSKLTLTQHPVETGANITDHSYVNPNELSLEIGMSDAAIGGSDGNSVSVYQALRKLQEDRKPLTVVTRLKTYRNMMIESIASPDDYTTMYGLRASVFLREIIVVSTQTVKVSPRKGGDTQKVGQTNAGSKQPTAPQQSVLKQAASKLGF